MEKLERVRVDDKVDKSTASPSNDDSLADFKSPKAEQVAQLAKNVKILNDRRAKKSNSGSKNLPTGRKKKESIPTVRQTIDEAVQPSIESSFFKAANIANRDGHTCPLCLKYFTDAIAGTAHSKNCATKNYVSTKKLLAAVALQQRQGDERRAIGLPAGPFVRPRENTPRRNREPVSKIDPDLQLALALSKSLQENEMEKEFEEALLLAAEHQGEEPVIEITNSQRRQTLKNFGFSTNKPAAPGILEVPIRSRRKKRLGPTILQTRSQESRDRLLTERIAEILMGNEAITQICQPTNFDQVEKSKSVLKSRLLKKIHRTTMRLWESAQLSTEITNFYVEDLRALVMPLADRQQDSFPYHTSESKASALKKEDESSLGRTNNDSPRVVDEKIVTEISDSSEKCANDIATNSSTEMRNIHVTDRQYRNAVPADWSNILNVSSLSDVVILVKNNHIWAHKLVFHVRCSDILLDCEHSEDTKFAHVKERICWPDVDFLTGLAFLEFVYSGMIEKNSHIFDDNRVAAGVRRLARKYRLKDLFDYLRKRKTEIGIRRDVETRREGLSTPIVVDVNEMRNEMENLLDNEIQDNRIRENHTKDSNIEENHMTVDMIEENHIKDDKIEENHIRDDKISENHNQNNESLENLMITGNIEGFSSQVSPCKELVEFSVTESNISVHKIPDEREIETFQVVSVLSSHRASTMSPDLFDETIRESERMEDDQQNSEKLTEEMGNLSSEENSNLRVLAQLIADDDYSSDQASQEFTPPASVESKIVNKIPAAYPSTKPIEDYGSHRTSQDFSATTSNEDKIVVNKILENTALSEIENDTIAKKRHAHGTLSQSHLETPRSRGIEADPLSINQRSRSQRLPDKKKSNLSMFIEKVRVINSKPALDSYNEEESLGCTIDRRRFRNPFNVNNASNRSVESGDNEKSPIIPVALKQIQPEKDSQMANEKKENLVNSSLNELTKFNVNSSTTIDERDEFSSVDDTIYTDDEDISMYSKYKKNNKRNDNSIANYRDKLKKLNKITGKTTNDEKNEIEIFSNEQHSIDLTQESDEDIDVPASSLSSIRPPSVRKCINRILDTDSNDSAFIRKNCTPELTTVVENNDSNVIDNRVIDGDSENSTTSSPLIQRKVGRKKKKSAISSDEDLEINIENITKDAKNSPNLSDLDVFEIDEEIFLQKNSNISPSKMSNASSNFSSPVTRNSTSSRPCKRKGESRILSGSFDNLAINQKIEDYVTLESSEGTKSPRNSCDYPDSDVFEVNEEIFTQNSRQNVKSPTLTPSPRFDPSRSSKSSRDKRKTDETRSKDTSSDDLTSQDDERQEHRSSRRRKSPKSSPEYPYFDLLQRNEAIFTQSSINLRNSPRETLSPSPHRGTVTPEKLTSRESKASFEEKTRKKKSLDYSEKSEESEQYCTDGFSPEGINSKITNDHRELDFYERNNDIFTQSLKKPDKPVTASSPLSSRETLGVTSPILISSSPDLDGNFEQLLACNEGDCNKENAVESNASPVDSRQSREEAENRFSPIYFEELESPRPSTSRSDFSSRRDCNTSNCVKKLMSRSISMPESTLNSDNNRKRTRTPKKSSRLMMSQQLTPPRNYDAMDTPELKRELEKYGIKPQKRKRARQLLTHIYNQLHPTVSITSSKRNSANNVVEYSDDEEPPSKKIGKINDRASNDSESDRDISLSQESVASRISVIAEEMELPDCDVSPEKIDGPISIKEAFTALLRDDKKLHTMVLTYEPLPFEILHSTLKEQGLKCKANDLMDFLDEECITFQVLAQLGKSRVKKVRGRKGSKAKG